MRAGLEPASHSLTGRRATHLLTPDRGRSSHLPPGRVALTRRDAVKFLSEIRWSTPLPVNVPNRLRSDGSLHGQPCGHPQLHPQWWKANPTLNHRPGALAFTAARSHPDIYIAELLDGMRMIHKVLPAIMRKVGVTKDDLKDPDETA